MGTSSLSSLLFHFASLLPLMGMILLWWDSGRDFDSTKSFSPDTDQQRNPFEAENLPIQNDPIPELTPAQVGVIVDEHVNQRDMVAEIFELARLGIIKVERGERYRLKDKGLLFQDYIITLLKPIPSTLAPYQVLLFNSLFEDGNTTTIRQQADELFIVFAEFKRLLIESIDKRKFYTNSIKYRDLYRSLAWGLMIVAATIQYVATDNHVIVFYIIVYLGIYLGYDFFVKPGKYTLHQIVIGIMVLAPAVLISSIIVASERNVFDIIFFAIQPFVFLYIAEQMPQRSKEGHYYYLKAKALQQRLKSGRWRQIKKETDLYIDDMLPYAVTLGITAQLTAELSSLVTFMQDEIIAEKLHAANLERREMLV